MKILVTGGAGFIGSNLIKKLLDNGDDVTAIDNFNNYYNEGYKHKNIDTINSEHFNLLPIDINDVSGLEKIFKNNKFNKIVHLAAAVGVRNSLINPHLYLKTNIEGTLNILEQARINKIKDIVFASSSSVYGNDTKLPSNETSMTEKPLNPYAMSKKSAELLCYAYHKLYDLNITILRFFTVYGPHGRPDMSPYIFIESILAGKQLTINGDGSATRDFTYIDDIVEGVVRLIDKVTEPNPGWSGDDPDSATSYAPYRLYNIGNNNPVELMKFIEVLEDCLGKKAKKNLLPMQPGDVPATYADVDDLIKDVGFKPTTAIEEGIKKFVEWYREYYEK